MEEKLEIKDLLNLTEEFLGKMGVSYDSLDTKEEEGRMTVLIYTKNDSKILIGKFGANLFSLTRVLNLIVKKKYGRDAQIFLDVNDYYKENLDLIKKKALMIAERVKSYQIEMELEPMNALERRFVHSLFGVKSGITTRSKGFGDERRVVVGIQKDNSEEETDNF